LPVDGIEDADEDEDERMWMWTFRKGNDDMLHRGDNNNLLHAHKEHRIHIHTQTQTHVQSVASTGKCRETQLQQPGTNSNTSNNKAS